MGRSWRTFFVFSLIFLFISLNIASILMLNNKSLTKDKTISINANEVEIKVKTDEDPSEDGSYKAGTEFTFEVNDDGYSTVKIELKGSEREWDLEMDLTADVWGVVWNTKEPSSGEDPVPAGTYTVNLIIDGDSVDSDLKEIVITAETDYTLIIIIIIIGVIVAVGVSGFVVFKKKRAGKAADNLEFGAVDKGKKKKRGEIYKGASTIGRQSGQIAETKKKEKTTGVDILESDKSKAVPSIQAETKTQKGTETGFTKKQLMPAASGFQFEEKLSTSMAMVKNLESKMNLEQKTDFLTSKVETSIQNIDIFKAILMQHQQEVLSCPKCHKIMSKYWIKCPYCEIIEHDSELGLKQSMLLLGKDVRFCPVCKQIIKPNWVECPFCLSNRKN